MRIKDISFTILNHEEDEGSFMAASHYRDDDEWSITINKNYAFCGDLDTIKGCRDCFSELIEIIEHQEALQTKK